MLTIHVPSGYLTPSHEIHHNLNLQINSSSHAHKSAINAYSKNIKQERYVYLTEDKLFFIFMENSLFFYLFRYIINIVIYYIYPIIGGELAMENKNSYNPFRLLSDVHLTEDMSCCTDTYLLDRSTMKCEEQSKQMSVSQSEENEK